MENLDEIRKRINDIDARIAELFEERMVQSYQVAQFKLDKGLSITDPIREAEVIRKNSALIKDDEIREYFIDFQKNLMKDSKEYQSRLMRGMRIAYSGVPGAWAHIAAMRMFPQAEMVAFPDFESAYAACESGDCNVAVLPIENSFSGDVGTVMDLMFSGNLYVNQVIEIAAQQNLLGCKGATRDSIREVVSHPQALSQCADYIRDAGYVTHEFPNTAKAAEYVAHKADPTIGAIASAEAAEIFGLEIIDRKINTSAVNTTRFAAFSRVLNTSPSKSKTGQRFILNFTVRNEAGALAKTLNIIGAHGYNMCALKSRPMKDLNWNYCFYMELDGNIHNSEGRDMLQGLASVCDRLKLVGSFNLAK